MSKEKIEKVYALTAMEEGMVYDGMVEGNWCCYFREVEVGIRGEFDEGVFEKSLNEVIQR
ncbi:hypothetical protein [Bacillus pumilus]|uniref:hypothetical protein n=1 Tax=Bacillus pumilus TaxID=1408 RepID=UPI0011A6366D|nr:hypothetical protein [Bacillus pumilus]